MSAERSQALTALSRPVIRNSRAHCFTCQFLMHVDLIMRETRCRRFGVASPLAPDLVDLHVSLLNKRCPFLAGHGILPV